MLVLLSVLDELWSMHKNCYCLSQRNREKGLTRFLLTECLIRMRSVSHQMLFFVFRKLRTVIFQPCSSVKTLAVNPPVPSTFGIQSVVLVSMGETVWVRGQTFIAVGRLATIG